jgi:hypothetical protein
MFQRKAGSGCIGQKKTMVNLMAKSTPVNSAPTSVNLDATVETTEVSATVATAPRAAGRPRLEVVASASMLAFIGGLSLSASNVHTCKGGRDGLVELAIRENVLDADGLPATGSYIRRCIADAGITVLALTKDGGIRAKVDTSEAGKAARAAAKAERANRPKGEPGRPARPLSPELTASILAYVGTVPAGKLPSLKVCTLATMDANATGAQALEHSAEVARHWRQLQEDNKIPTRAYTTTKASA